MLKEGPNISLILRVQASVLQFTLSNTPTRLHHHLKWFLSCSEQKRTKPKRGCWIIWSIFYAWSGFHALQLRDYSHTKSLRVGFKNIALTTGCPSESTLLEPLQSRAFILCCQLLHDKALYRLHQWERKVGVWYY